MKKLALSLAIFSLAATFPAQAQSVPRPKLVVGVVIDQMRYDYLYRFMDRYSAGGFRRLLKAGFSCEQTFLPYTPTQTAPGHTCIYTGSVPAIHGIMANQFFIPATHKTVYCAGDTSVQTVGSPSDEGEMSPRNLQVSTITDELRLAQNFRSKTIAVALKDRGSIFPGGHSSNGSYWFDETRGVWISSTWYMQTLPAWVQKLNDRREVDKLIRQPWNLLFPASTYVQSHADKVPFENRLPGEDSEFPHQLDTLAKNRFLAFKYTPAAIGFTLDMAKEAVVNEKLGQSGLTDFLAVSISSTDYVGHAFGPNSMEIEDMYLRLDRELAAFIDYLDLKVGKGNYLFFLTADHAAGSNPQFLTSNKLPAGTARPNQWLPALKASVDQKFQQQGLVDGYSNMQLFLNRDLISSKNLDRKQITDFIISELRRVPEISDAIDLQNIANTTLPEPLKMMVSNGYNPKLSGDVQIIDRPGYYDGLQAGASHGKWNNYDSHIPLVFYGWNVTPGQLMRTTYMTDISATLAAMLHIQMPSGCIGKPIPEVSGR